MKRDNFPSPVSEVLERVFSRRGIRKKMKEMNTLKLWREVVGKKVDKHTYPFSVRKGNLFVRVDNSGWLTQLTYLKEKIILEFNKKQGKKVIKEIYFRLGEVRKNKEEKVKKSPPDKKLEKAELARIGRSLKEVKDKSLYHALRRVLIKDKKFKKNLTGRHFPENSESGLEN